MKKLFIILIIAFFSCDDEEVKINCDPVDRIGAICNDGYQSTATGSGACSSHGGVKEWICK